MSTARPDTALQSNIPVQLKCGSAILSIEHKPSGRMGSAVVTARLNDEPLAVETVNLTKLELRRKFAEDLAKNTPCVNVVEVESVLLRIGAELLKRPDTELQDPTEPDSHELLQRMPQHVRDAAQEMLKSPDLMERIVEDIAKCGVAGERDLSATIYLVGTSRLLPKPLAAIIQSPSSTGKSYVIDTAALLFPSEGLLLATAITPQAMYYLKPGSLRHKFVVAGERSRRQDDETADATKALREMISSGKLTKLVTEQEGNQFLAKQIIQEGPIAFVESTTAPNIFNENANRCLVLNTDERQEQTRRILRRIATDSSGEIKAAIVLKHHALQRLLEPRPVFVPFQQRLADLFPAERVEARRAFGHLLSMVKAVALLHQYQREIDADGRIIATSIDYEIARRLCCKPLARLLGRRISDGARRFYERVASRANSSVFSTTQAAEWTNMTSQTARDYLAELNSVRAVEQAEPSRGSKPAMWLMKEADWDELSSDCQLPVVQDLSKAGDGLEQIDSESRHIPFVQVESCKVKKSDFSEAVLDVPGRTNSPDVGGVTAMPSYGTNMPNPPSVNPWGI